MSPARADDAWARLVADNLRAVWPNYRRLGIKRLVLAGTVHSAEILEAYRGGDPGGGPPSGVNRRASGAVNRGS